jgi:hypothetical protein
MARGVYKKTKPSEEFSSEGFCVELTGIEPVTS